jgi:nucleotide-binding universal stress UspA family protein
VVVGIDDQGACTPALGIAFRAAAQRGVPLTVVQAWTPDVPADHEAVCGSVAASEARAGELLHQALDPWRSRFADVPVATRPPTADPAAALIRESEGAALVVVGSRVGKAARVRLFGSVRRSVAQQARCPVVVRNGQVSVDEYNESGRRTAVPGVAPIGIEPVHRRSTPWE